MAWRRIGYCRNLVLGMSIVLSLCSAGQAQNKDQAQQFLQQLDACFNADDLEAYLQNFQPVHDSLHERFRRRMAMVLGQDLGLQRESKIQDYFQQDGKGIVLVQSTTSCGTPNAQPHVEHAYLALGQAKDQVRALFYIETNPGGQRHIEDGVFRCKACNYQIGTPNKWLVVPFHPEGSGCMESVAFLSLQHNLSLQVSVHLSLGEEAARSVLQQYLQGQKGLQSAKAAKIKDWDLAKSRGATGAQSQITLADGDQLQFYLLVHGAARYFFTLQGSAKAIQSQQMQWHALLNSFMFLEEISPQTLHQRALKAHTGGGSFQEQTYLNPTYKIQVEGPATWGKTLQAGGSYAFLLTYQHPTGPCYMKVRAMPPPTGFTRWTQAMADEMLEGCCSSLNLQSGTDSGWQGKDNPQTLAFRWRQLEPKQGYSLIRMDLRDSLLVITQAKALNQESKALIHKAAGTIAPCAGK